MKKFLLKLIVGYFLIINFVAAQTLPSPVIAAKSWLLLDVTANQYLALENVDVKMEPASLTKLMTAYVTFSALQTKKISLDQKVNVSERAWKVDRSSSKMFIDPATPVSINDLLYGLMVQSGNDAAIALAEAVAGTEDTFVNLMNREAQRIGMKNTHFSNPHGLPSPENYSTARDLSLLATRIILEYPQFYKIDSTKYFTYNKITQPNRNRLLWLDPSVDGMKTGHTDNAGYCLIASAKRPNGNGERRLLSVVLGADSDQARIQESQKLLNWGYQNFDAVKLYTKGQVVAKPELWKGKKNQLNIGFNRDIYLSLPKGNVGKIKPILETKTPLLAPITEGQTIGTLKVVIEGKKITEFPVVALEKVEQANVFGSAWDSIRLWFK
jgi:D-alanyl-D-alanine carboxypeptidase (penicillin-binding protein 5/6)